MHYYSHHMGDFDRATRHLTRIERSIYRDMLDLYYETETQLTLDIALLCRKILARTEDEKAAVLAVLDEFFHETPTGWFHDRCEEEIAEYHKTKSQASAAGKASAAARAERRLAAMGQNPTGDERRATDISTPVQRPFNDRSTEVQQTLNELPTNQEPVTSNHKPVEAKKTQRASRLPADWSPNSDELTFCKTERPELNPQVVAANFRDYWIAKPGKEGTKLDWSATWRTWVRNERNTPQTRAAPEPTAKDWI